VNFYGREERNVTHYGQTVEDNILDPLMTQLAEDGEYELRRRAVAQWNASNPVIKRGIAITPVKFGISFNATHFNQAGALLCVYTDGTVLLNHGGTEMGQGVHTKVMQVVAAEFGLPLSAIRISTTDTSKVPNTSATAASSGADLNGKAAQEAARVVRQRLVEWAQQHECKDGEEVRFADGYVHLGAKRVTFKEFVGRAYMARVPLFAMGYYRTPKIHWNRAEFRGRPFFYFAYGAAISEVAIDTLTGESRILHVDILHDVGASLNPAIDIGQIEGGFLQGAGWLTSEELWWTPEGELKTHAPSTYKIPTAYDWPASFRVRFFDAANREETIHFSKAVGEPPLMLAISVFHAMRDAVASCASRPAIPVLDAPATPEAVLRAIARVRGAE
jgi:xanthine dehydrogenase large subunit